MKKNTFKTVHETVVTFRINDPGYAPPFSYMFSKEEASRLRQQFWTTFGQYLKPLPSADGLRVNWMNYKTGHRQLFFRMDASRDGAFIGIMMAQKDRTLQSLYYEQFLDLRTPLEAELGEQWQWETDYLLQTGQQVHVIYHKLDNVNIYRQADWPNFIQFFKPRIIALDSFWSMAQGVFLELQDL